MPDIPIILKRMLDMYASLSTSQQQIVDVILRDPETAAFYNVAELARAAKVSDATVTRFARAVGYSGFPELSRQLQSVVRMRLTTKERLEKAHTGEGNQFENMLSQSIEEDIQNLQMFQNQLDVDGLEQCAKKLATSRKIGIICARSTLSIGLFFQFYLNILRKDTWLITGEPRTLDYLARLDSEQDVAVGIGFSRYSQFTITSLKYLHEKEVPTFVVTDYPSSPLVNYAMKAFYCPTGIASFMDSLVAPLALFQALIRRISSEQYASTREELSRLEEVWNQFDVYYGHEL